MFSSIINRRSLNFNRRLEMTDEQVRAQAPSVFAAAPVVGVSERYVFLPTSQIIGRMREEGWAPVEVAQQAVRAEGRMGFQKHLIRFQRRDQIAKAGEYTPELCLVNSHDRSSAYQLHAALFRFVCSNGLMVSDSTIEQVSIRHSGRETDEVLSASFALFGQVHRLADRVAAFQSKQLNSQQQHDFAARAIALRWDGQAPLSPAKALWPRRQEDTGSDLWSVFNRLQENLIRGGQRDYSVRKEDGHRFAKTRPVRGLDEGIRLNKELWDLAAGFCQN